MKGKGFTNAGELRTGEAVVDSEGGTYAIETIYLEIVESPETVYNFQVEDYHTYHVGNIGVLVHNKDYGDGRDVTGDVVEDGSRTVNGFNTTINAGKQGKHIVGHNNYIEGRSVFQGTLDDAQRLVNEFGGTGEWIGVNKERVNFGQEIGQYVNPATGEVLDTTVGIIHYSNTGTHIVPARPIR